MNKQLIIHNSKLKTTYLHVPTTNKAKRDVEKLMAEQGCRCVSLNVPGEGKIATFFTKLLSVAKIPLVLRKDDVLLIQYPYKKFYAITCIAAHIRGAKVLTLIHDLGTFRRHKLTAEQEIRRLSHSDYIITHNKSMTDWLVNHGCKVPMTELEIFDYVGPEQGNPSPKGSDRRQIVYAGGLGDRKNKFLFDMEPLLGELRLNIYGRGLDERKTVGWKQMQYKGFMASDDFITKVSGDWGLVWDGDSVEECSGNWGEYLKINNPHKTSFYLMAGLPVILWRKAAMAPFIESEKVGITVDNLRQLPERISAISAEEYAEMQGNVRRLGQRLRTGCHLFEAIGRLI